jgi:hypothetical protein
MRRNKYNQNAFTIFMLKKRLRKRDNWSSKKIKRM